MSVQPLELRMTYGHDASPQTANEWLRANVRELMDLRKWTQQELAERLGVSQPWLSKRLTGRTPFHMRDLDAIAHVFGLSPHELLCAGYGQWDRRHGSDRRSGDERRRHKPEPQPIRRPRDGEGGPHQRH